jgi:hypothetical protein
MRSERSGLNLHRRAQPEEKYYRASPASPQIRRDTTIFLMLCRTALLCAHFYTVEKSRAISKNSKHLGIDRDRLMASVIASPIAPRTESLTSCLLCRHLVETYSAACNAPQREKKSSMQMRIICI